MQISNIASAWAGYKYRCLVDGVNSNEINLKSANTWQGTVSSAWENPQNWSCNVVPDQYTDVYVPSGTVILSSNTTVNKLNLNNQ